MKYLNPCFWALSLVFAIGCSNTTNTIVPASFASQRAPIKDRRIITDDNLNAIVDVISIYESKVSGDLKKVSVELHNHRSGPRNFNYKFEWYDASGMAVATPATAFVSAEIQGRETISISSVAPSPAAVDFRLKLLNDSRD